MRVWSGSGRWTSGPPGDACACAGAAPREMFRNAAPGCGTALQSSTRRQWLSVGDGRRYYTHAAYVTSSPVMGQKWPTITPLLSPPVGDGRGLQTLDQSRQDGQRTFPGAILRGV